MGAGAAAWLPRLVRLSRDPGEAMAAAAAVPGLAVPWAWLQLVPQRRRGMEQHRGAVGDRGSVAIVSARSSERRAWRWQHASSSQSGSCRSLSTRDSAQTDPGDFTHPPMGSILAWHRRAQQNAVALLSRKAAHRIIYSAPNGGYSGQTACDNLAGRVPPSLCPSLTYSNQTLPSKGYFTNEGTMSSIFL